MDGHTPSRYILRQVGALFTIIFTATTGNNQRHTRRRGCDNFGSTTQQKGRTHQYQRSCAIYTRTPLQSHDISKRQLVAYISLRLDCLVTHPLKKSTDESTQLQFAKISLHYQRQGQIQSTCKSSRKTEVIPDAHFRIIISQSQLKPRKRLMA